MERARRACAYKHRGLVIARASLCWGASFGIVKWAYAKVFSVDIARSLQIIDVEPSLCTMPTNAGLTPLMLAAGSKQVKALLFLLMLGAPPDAATGAPGLAAAMQKAEAARAAKQPQQQSQQPPAPGGVPAPASAAGERSSSASQQAPVVVDVLAQDEQGRTALHHAALVDDTASVVALLSTLPRAPDRHCKSLSATEHAECALCSCTCASESRCIACRSILTRRHVLPQ
jgi:ankyrin repeat protein